MATKRLSKPVTDSQSGNQKTDFDCFDRSKGVFLLSTVPGVGLEPTRP